MIGHRVHYSYALTDIYRSTLFPQVIQAISPIAYSDEANYGGTLEVDDLCKLPFLCCLNIILICSMLSIQPKAHNPKQNSFLKLCLASY